VVTRRNSAPGGRRNRTSQSFPGSARHSAWRKPAGSYTRFGWIPSATRKVIRPWKSGATGQSRVSVRGLHSMSPFTEAVTYSVVFGVAGSSVVRSMLFDTSSGRLPAVYLIDRWDWPPGGTIRSVKRVTVQPQCAFTLRMRRAASPVFRMTNRPGVTELGRTTPRSRVWFITSNRGVPAAT